MNNEEIKKLAAGGQLELLPREGDAIPIKPEPTEEQIEAAAQKAAKAEIDAMPFTPENMKAAAQRQFERRAPEWIKNAEARVRNMAVFGEDYCGFKAHDKDERPSRYQDLLMKHFAGVGFVVIETTVGFDVELT